MSDEPLPVVKFADRLIGPGQPVYVIAEAGVNHNGNMEIAHRLIDLAVEHGADAVKFQAFKAEELCAANAVMPEYARLIDAPDQRTMLKELELPAEAFLELSEHAEGRGIDFLCSAFDEPSLRMLIDLDLIAYKFAATELTNDRLIDLAAGTGRPLILSAGACTFAEVEQAIDRLGQTPVLLLHCVSSYSTPDEDANLSSIARYRRRFGRPVGFSDHTLGIDVAPLAIAQGAVAVEKHVTTDKRLAGPDHRLSLDPAEFGRFVEKIRWAERVMGKPREDVLECERDVCRSARKSVVSRRNLAAGESLVETDLTLKRPGTGISAAEFDKAIGRKAKSAIPADTVVTWEMLE